MNMKVGVMVGGEEMFGNVWEMDEGTENVGWSETDGEMGMKISMAPGGEPSKPMVEEVAVR